VNRAVFLDRDGVINRVVLRGGRPYAPTVLEEFEFLPGVREAVHTLSYSGLRVIVVTNQPDVAKGLVRREVVDAMHEKILSVLPIDEIKVCYHVDDDACGCRKPKPGMLLDASEKWSLNLSMSYMVGDRWRDIEAGRAAGCKTILVGDGYAERTAKDPDAVVASLFEAAQLIVTSML
jgi:D-glycero-D-manno-heptose 1,7-bisphosphate phosphatase